MLNFKVSKQKIYDNEVYGEIEIYFDSSKKVYTVDFITHFVDEMKNVNSSLELEDRFIFHFYEDDGVLFFKKEADNCFSLYYGREKNNQFLVDEIICENINRTILNNAVTELIIQYEDISIS